MCDNDESKASTFLHGEQADSVVSIEDEDSCAAWNLAAVITHDLECDDAIRRQRSNLLCRETVLRGFRDQVSVNCHEFGKGAALRMKWSATVSHIKFSRVGSPFLPLGDQRPCLPCGNL